MERVKEAFTKTTESSRYASDDITFPPIPVGDLKLAARTHELGTREIEPMPNELLRLADDLRVEVLKVVQGAAVPGPAAFVRLTFNYPSNGVVDLGTLPWDRATARTYVLDYKDGRPLAVMEVWRHADPILAPIDPESFARRFRIPRSAALGGEEMRRAIMTVLRERGLSVADNDLVSGCGVW